MKDEIEITMNQKIYQIDAFATRLLAKLGNDGFSLALFGTKVADSEEFCKKSTKTLEGNNLSETAFFSRFHASAWKCR